MSNNQNTIIEEKIWEHLEFLYDTNDEFKYQVSIAAEQNATEEGFFNKDDYSDICWEYLEQIHNWIIDKCEHYIPYAIEDTLELALETLK